MAKVVNCRVVYLRRPAPRIIVRCEPDDPEFDDGVSIIVCVYRFMLSPNGADRRSLLDEKEY